MLTIEARWEGQPACFGSPYICAIGDTVTGGECWVCCLCGAGRLVAGAAGCAAALWHAPARLCQATCALCRSPLCAAGQKGTEGSLEYLVYTNALVSLAPLSLAGLLGLPSLSVHATTGGTMHTCSYLDSHALRFVPTLWPTEST